MKAFRAIAAGAVALVTALAGCSAPTTPTPSASSSEPAKSTRALRVWAGSTTPITIDFNPFHSIAHHIERPLRIHHPGLTDAEIRDRTVDLLERVSLGPADPVILDPQHPYTASLREAAADPERLGRLRDEVRAEMGGRR